jgi:predicted phage tail component-like protein
MNGVNSLTIQGLAIRELPPISKPSMRNIKEEIDGRNGDIITELGYSAYDKELEIGLYGESYDINDIIAFFNGKGTITFSDEPDKYYYYQILNQIDYEKLLKFKTASVVFHCQPFKYKVDEVPLEEEFEYVEGEGTDITLNNTANAIFSEFDLKGNTEQDGTPTPTDPIEVETTTGNQVITICGKNLFDYKTSTFSAPQNVNITTQNNTITITTTETTTSNNLFFLTKIPDHFLQNGETYTISSENVSGVVQSLQLQLRNKDGSFVSGKSQANSVVYDSNYSLYIAKNLFATTNISIPAGTTAIIKNVQVEKGIATTYEEYKGNDYEINLGKNLLNLQLNNIKQYNTGGTWNDNVYTHNGLTITVNADKTITINGTSTAQETFLLEQQQIKYPAGTYYLSGAINGNNDLYDVRMYNYNGAGAVAQCFTGTRQINVVNNGQNYNISIVVRNGQTLNNVIFYPMFSKSNDTNFAPYFTPIEICKIGNYQDYLYKENNNWYIHKVIGKVILDGSENWYRGTSANTRSVFALQTFTDRLTSSTSSEFYSSNFYYRGNAQGTDLGYAMSFGVDPYSRFLYTQVPTDVVAPGEIANFKTWLSTHKTDLYYILETPTDEEITNEELINQLDALMLATSQEGQTNIFQSTFNLPFIIKASALKENSDHLIINNIGNTFAKPTLDLEGTGIVDIYLNDVEVFQVDLSVVNEIVLNTAEMEAYNPNTHQLANRQVTGDYSNFKLDVGENDLRFSGNLTKATVTYYMRWL